MKKIIKLYIISFAIVVWTVAITLISYHVTGSLFTKEPSVVEVVEPEIEETVDIYWDLWLLFHALAYVESYNNPNAVGKNKDWGLVQITPIFVKEINRQLGYERFSHEDAFCPELSWEMFKLYNDFKNRDLCLLEAVRLHNPRAPQKYRDRVMREYLRLKNIDSRRNSLNNKKE
jgi:hypothetical protein